MASDEYKTVDPWKTLVFRLHILVCHDCRRYARQLRALAAAFRNAAQTLSLPELEAVRARILEQAAGKS